MEYSWKQVKKCNGENGSYWIVIHGNVHNVTQFLKIHPGGEEVLMNLSGKDGTQCFDEIGHSDEAKQLCESYKIGKLVEERSGMENCKKNKTLFVSVGGYNCQTIREQPGIVEQHQSLMNCEWRTH